MIVPQRRLRSTKNRVSEMMEHLKGPEAETTPAAGTAPQQVKLLEVRVSTQSCEFDSKGFLSNHVQSVEGCEPYTKYEIVLKDNMGIGSPYDRRPHHCSTRLPVLTPSVKYGQSLASVPAHIARIDIDSSFGLLGQGVQKSNG